MRLHGRRLGQRRTECFTAEFARFICNGTEEDELRSAQVSRRGGAEMLSGSEAAPVIYCSERGRIDGGRTVANSFRRKMPNVTYFTAKRGR